jgi:hypothetical protein
MVQLELAKWLSHEAGDDKADRVIAFTATCGFRPRHGHRAVGGGTMLYAQAGHGRCYHIRNGTGL